MIKAKCWSDDYIIEENFDATLFVEQAIDEQLLNIIKCEYRGDYPTDEIAHFMANHDINVESLFQYLDIVGKKKTIGFECSIDEKELNSWIEKNRPVLFKKILKFRESQ